ncbi:MAG TPA: DUF1634 domain-containing protein [Tepidisphaeraceae bacterium]|nr:DUF1634 domain-containing protein [Tepidisphaeraceae bacterium]
MDQNSSQTSASAPPGSITIQDVSAWVLRIGVVSSVTVMLLGIALSFLHRTASLERLEHDQFEYCPGLVWQGVTEGSGKAVVEVGIYLLVLTPIIRVFSSIILFAIEKDWLYAMITALVLILTLTGLLLLD